MMAVNNYTFASSCSPMTNYCQSKTTKKKKWTLNDLSSLNKEVVYKHIKRMLFERKVKEYMKGLNWILYFIGLGILFNFSRILDIIELMVK